jgi:hypothetical protein
VSLHPSLAYGPSMSEYAARALINGGRAASPRSAASVAIARPARGATRSASHSFIASFDPVMPAGTHRVCGEPDPLITGWSCYLDSGHPGAHLYER